LPKAVVRYIRVTECRRLVNVCSPDFQKLVKPALLTGCRYCELTRLKCEGFNRDSGTLAIRLGKGKVRHEILTDEGQDVFQDWTADRPAADRVFLRADGKAWGASHQKRPLDEASRQAGISPAVNFHILRHTYASHLAMKGVPMGIIAAQLGHVDTRMTEKHYAHLSPSYVAQTIRANFPVLNLAAESHVVPLRKSVATST
jgi:integrase